MRNTLLVALCATGCAVHAQGSRGITRAEYQGGVHVVFTNATPAKMCELRMSSDAQPDYGDNWLPDGGLASGASLKLNVRPGTYKAVWSTCAIGSKDGYYAGTLWHDTAVEVSADVQLYAYVAGNIAPSSVARPLGVDYTVVRFQGQPIGPIAAATTHPTRTQPETQVSDSTDAPRPTAKLGAAAFIDPAATKQTRRTKSAKRPSLARTHDVTTGSVAYRAR